MTRIPRNGPPKTSDLQSLEADLAIDEHGLEHACATQPELYYKVAQALALALSRRDAAKLSANEIEASVDIRIRTELTRQNEKVTEKAIERLCSDSDEVQAARSDIHKHDTEVLQLEALKESFQQRSYMLKELVSLHLGAYYGDVSQDARAAKEARARLLRESSQ